ncbi:hypothetical protein D3C78_1902460 [compost metagenome]
MTTHVAFGLVGKIAVSWQNDEVDKEVTIIFRAIGNRLRIQHCECNDGCGACSDCGWMLRDRYEG